ncbi:chemotaxis protein CheW [Candidatus Venteria ishoeyi]|uniref:Chemotaxis protein CheA n=1 Tax=Candidatus Venteria ishoeyi TaxID=1899563 RepID=A0A1H6F9U0_9GAMM|nr:chemotaxis protein CheW [Candidatus Venteria ishoeyi]SEH06079.1 Chemotaxis protein CheA [Candidatus Venteria ishoeyi]
MSMEQLRQLFIMESGETLNKMEDALLLLENDKDNKEALNVVFRAVHTIKGSAGIVNLSEVSQFAHGVENLLDRVRKGQLQFDTDLIQLILACQDYLQNSLNAIADDADEDVIASLQQQAQKLNQNISQYLEASEKAQSVQTQPSSEATPDNTAKAEKIVEQPIKKETDKPGEDKTASENIAVAVPPSVQASAATDNVVEGTSEALSDMIAVEDEHWHISLRFGLDALRNGVEPLATLDYLKQYGDIVNLTTLCEHMPLAEEMDPENCYLGFEIAFAVDPTNNVTKADIEALFELIIDDCQVQILPPHAQLSQYIHLIQELPEDTFMLGEILQKIGTLTERELETGLEQQDIKPAEGAVKTVRKLGEILVDGGMVNPDVVTAALHKQQQIKEHKITPESLLKIKAEKLDRLINQVGELVIATARIKTLLETSSDTKVVDEEREYEQQQQGQHNALKESVSFMSRLVEEIRNSALGMRMVQIGSSFNRFNRLVHDLSQAQGKKIELQIQGADTELDKSMVEKIHDPLMHLVRNAIDHGLETPQQRLAQGKSERGLLQLNAYHDAGNIVIEISDDGQGLDRQAIFNAAVKKGIIGSEQSLESLSESFLDSLIFEPGLTTSSIVTSLSGRGVGMDVVQYEITRLNGSVNIKSQTGQGTRIQMYLPLTLAIIDGFLVNIGDYAYVIPLDKVVECAALTVAAGEECPDYLHLRDKGLPLLYLRKLFDIQSALPERQHVIVVRYGQQEIGVVVEGIQGEFQAVIKPLGALFNDLSGISGATVLGNGEVALILDVAALIAHVSEIKQYNSHADVSQQTTAMVADKSEEYLIFELAEQLQADQLTHRYGIPVRYIHQVMGKQRLLPAPGMPPFISGLLNLSDATLPVLDLYAYFGHETAKVDQHNSLIVVEVEQDGEQVRLALQAHHVYQVTAFDSTQISPATQLLEHWSELMSTEEGFSSEYTLASKPHYFIQGVSQFKDIPVLLLDIPELFSRQDLSFGLTQEST